MSRNFFYSRSEKIAFLISDYCDHSKATDLINMIEEHIKEFDRRVGAIDDLRTKNIDVSGRYRGHRLFWHTEIDECPEGAFEIGDGSHPWTMREWILDGNREGIKVCKE